MKAIKLEGSIEIFPIANNSADIDKYIEELKKEVMAQFAVPSAYLNNPPALAIKYSMNYYYMNNTRHASECFLIAWRRH